MTKPTEKHIQRIREELKKVGVSRYGLAKSESRYLPHIIHQTEKIGGVVYGWYENGMAMIIATDKRVIFLDKKPLFTTKDEITYDVVSGVRIDVGALYTSATLHTRVKDYSLKYVNPGCAKTFVKYIESQRLEVLGDMYGSSEFSIKKETKEVQTKPEESFPFLTYDAKLFLNSNTTAVLSTKSVAGKVEGAVIFYIVDQLDRVYILTKEGTSKAKNFLKNQQVALTIFNEENLQTLQIDGFAEVETDQKVKNYVFSEISEPRKINGKTVTPPVVNMNSGAFLVIRITIKGGMYSDFSAKK